MRRLFGVVLLCSSLALIGASRPPARPTAVPSPSPTPSATPLAADPVVIVYPFDQSGGLQASVGTSIAQIYTQALTNAGKLKVLPVGQNVKRTDYLTNARAEKADYYISGYATPIGNSAAVVAQVVSADSGIIVYSDTTQVYGVPDVASQSLKARAVILELTGQQTDVNAAQSNATPEPSATNGAAASIGLGNIVSSIFRKGSKATPSPAPTPRTKPARGAIVARVQASGDVPGGDATTATDLLSKTLSAYYDVSATAVDAHDPVKVADAICGSHRDNTIVVGTLSEKRGGGFRPKTDFTFALNVYTCFGSSLYQTTQHAGALAAAVSAAVEAYATAHPGNN